MLFSINICRLLKTKIPSVALLKDIYTAMFYSLFSMILGIRLPVRKLIAAADGNAEFFLRFRNALLSVNCSKRIPIGNHLLYLLF